MPKKIVKNQTTNQGWKVWEPRDHSIPAKRLTGDKNAACGILSQSPVKGDASENMIPVLKRMLNNILKWYLFNFHKIKNKINEIPEYLVILFNDELCCNMQQMPFL